MVRLLVTVAVIIVSMVTPWKHGHSDQGGCSQGHGQVKQILSPLGSIPMHETLKLFLKANLPTGIHWAPMWNYG